MLALQSDVDATRLHTFLSGAHHWRLNGSSRAEDIIEDIRNDSRVEYVDLNHLGTYTFDPNEPEYPLQWPPPKIQANTAWDIETGDPNVVVAVIDSGVLYYHPDLTANIWVNNDPLNGIDDDNNGFIDDTMGWDFASSEIGDRDPLPVSNRHGTWVAGVIGAPINNIGVAGIAPVVRLMILNAGDFPIDEAAAIKSIDYAVMERANVITTVCKASPRCIKYDMHRTPSPWPGGWTLTRLKASPLPRMPTPFKA